MLASHTILILIYEIGVDRVYTGTAFFTRLQPLSGHCPDPRLSNRPASSWCAGRSVGGDYPCSRSSFAIWLAISNHNGRRSAINLVLRKLAILLFKLRARQRENPDSVFTAKVRQTFLLIVIVTINISTNQIIKPEGLDVDLKRPVNSCLIRQTFWITDHVNSSSCLSLGWKSSF